MKTQPKGRRASAARPKGQVVSIDRDKPASLAALAYKQLYRDIMDGGLEPGRKLLVADLHETYDIGLSPLRDALNRLCADGLVEKREQKGFFVCGLNEGELLDITNLRLVLEETALRLAIQNGGTEWEEKIVLAYYRLSKAATAGEGEHFALTPAWSQAHEEFHFGLLNACHNEWLLNFCHKLYEQLTRYRVRRRLLSAASQPVRSNLLQEHKDILDACLARNADQASQLLIEHYKRSFELVMNTEFRLLANPRRLMPVDGKALPQASDREAATEKPAKARRRSR